jgi:hypothetical protein
VLGSSKYRNYNPKNFGREYLLKGKKWKTENITLSQQFQNKI